MCFIVSSIDGYDIAVVEYRALHAIKVFDNVHDVEITVRTCSDEYGAAVLNKDDIAGLPARVAYEVETVANQFFYYAAFPMAWGHIWEGWYELSNGMFLQCWEDINPVDWEESGYPDDYGSVYYDIYTDPEKEMTGLQPDDGGLWEYSTPAEFADFMKWIKKAHGVSIVRRIHPPLTGGC